MILQVPVSWFEDPCERYTLKRDDELEASLEAWTLIQVSFIRKLWNYVFVVKLREIDPSPEIQAFHFVLNYIPRWLHWAAPTVWNLASELVCFKHATRMNRKFRGGKLIKMWNCIVMSQSSVHRWRSINLITSTENLLDFLIDTPFSVFWNISLAFQLQSLVECLCFVYFPSGG